ncbi:hypothetical protein FACS1894180_1520 [Bacteroidia bacterium]|nr:hypothetical protein FACS1894180_1520 [Bacteroidia bacterium]
MNSTAIFEIALGLQSPWKIREVQLQKVAEQKKELHIYLDFERGSKFVNRLNESVSAYDTE